MNLKQKIEEWEKTKKEISPWPWEADVEIRYGGEIINGIYDKTRIGKYGSPYDVLETDSGAYGPDLKTGLFIASAPENYDAAMQALKEAAELIKEFVDYDKHECVEELINTVPMAKNWYEKWGFEE